MQKVWNRIKTKLGDVSPEILDSLYDGASEEQIQQLEKKIGTPLPDDIKAFYRLHNGQNYDAEGLLLAQSFLSLEQVQHEWSIWKEMVDDGSFVEDDGKEFGCEADDGIKSDFWFNPLWIPFTHDGCGNHICIDLDPSDSGHVGQVIEMWHDSPERTLLAKSFEEWIQTFTNDLESGKIVYHEDWGLTYPMEVEA